MLFFIKGEIKNSKHDNSNNRYDRYVTKIYLIASCVVLFISIMSVDMTFNLAASALLLGIYEKSEYLVSETEIAGIEDRKFTNGNTEYNVLKEIFGVDTDNDNIADAILIGYARIQHIAKING